MRLRVYICRYRLRGWKSSRIFETSYTAENRVQALEFFKSNLPKGYTIMSVKWRR